MLKGIDLNKILRNMEVSLIKLALKATNRNRTHSARLLNIKRTTLVEKIRRFGIRL